MSFAMSLPARRRAALVFGPVQPRRPKRPAVIGGGPSRPVIDGAVAYCEPSLCARAMNACATRWPSCTPAILSIG